MKKIFLLSILLISLILIVSCAPKVSDEELQTQLSELSPEELEAVTAKDSGAVAGMAKADPKLAALKAQYQKAAKSNPVCSDNDADRSYPNGLNPFKKGIVKWTGGVVNGVEDQCASETLLRENYCSATPNGLRLAKPVNCAELNAKCVAGACAPVEAVPELFDWPTSDERLDVAHGNGIDFGKSNTESLADIPLVLSFGVGDNADIEKKEENGNINYILHYHWGYNGATSHDGTFLPKHIDFIKSYDPTFFDGETLDAANHFKKFMDFFKKLYPSIPVGIYISSTNCVKGAKNPYAENWYPRGMVDCYNLDPSGPEALGTMPTFVVKGAPPFQWSIPFGNEAVLNLYYNQVIEIIKKHAPPFVFLDNGVYIQPHWKWLAGVQDHDCRDKSTADLQACIDERAAWETGPIFMEDVIGHYKSLIKVLNDNGMRAVLNLGTPLSIFGLKKEIPKYAKDIEDVIGKNGLSFEQNFHPTGRKYVETIQSEVNALQRFLKQGKFVVLYADYGNVAESAWTAAMAMLVKDSGQSLFVARSNYGSPLWVNWPSQYGSPTNANANLELKGTDDNGENWCLSRAFKNGKITACRTGVEVGKSVDLNTALDLKTIIPAGEWQVFQAPQQGLLNGYIYTHTTKDDPNTELREDLVIDYLTLGQNCQDGFCKTLVSISIQVY